MAKEPFLINPPKRRKTAAGMKRHRILALESKDGGLFTSSRAKIVRKGIKINPFKRHRSNPFGELMFVGANPFKKGVKSMAKRRHKRNPAKRTKRRFHRNPMTQILSKSMLSMVAAGAAGVIASRMIPKMLPSIGGVNLSSGIANYGLKAAIVVGGGMAVDKFVGKAASEGWMIGSAAALVTEVVKDVLKTPLLEGLGLDLSEEAPILVAYNPDETVGMYEDDSVGMYEQA